MEAFKCLHPKETAWKVQGLQNLGTFAPSLTAENISKLFWRQLPTNLDLKPQALDTLPIKDGSSYKVKSTLPVLSQN